VSNQAKLVPVKTSNLPDNCPMTDCYFQACSQIAVARGDTYLYCTCNGLFPIVIMMVL